MSGWKDNTAIPTSGMGRGLVCQGERVMEGERRVEAGGGGGERETDRGLGYKER